MNTSAMKFLWLAAVCLMASLGGSLLAVWVLSNLAGFTFNPSIVAVLSAVACAAALALHCRRQPD